MNLFKKPKAGDKNLILAKTHDFVKDGPEVLTAVFIHGIASDSGSFTNALKYLEGTTSLKNVRFVTFDLLGAGKSTKSEELNYDYRDQITALHNAISELELKTPLVIVGHSMGTLIATRYADTYKKSVKKLILISPPVYRPEDLEMPAFRANMAAFKKAVAAKEHAYAHDKAFQMEIDKIVMNRYNYGRLAELKTKATLIYSEADEIIAPFNVRRVVKQNPKYLNSIVTIGAHRVARDKYSKIPALLEEVING